MSETNSASVVTVDGVETVVLREPSTESEVHVAVDLGSNVYRFETRVGERIVAVLAAPPDLATLRERPTRWGTACLFPYPGRIQGGRFVFGGRTVTLPVDPRDGNAIHGVVRSRPWRVAALEASEGGGASVTTVFSSALAGVPEAEWPFPFELHLTVSLRGGVLRIATLARNTGAAPMPLGLGFHPYFPTPFGPGDAGAVEVWCDATEAWLQGGGLPTGEIRRLAPGEGLRGPVPLRQVPADSQMPEGPVRNQLLRRDTRGPTNGPGGVHAGLIDRANGVSVTLEASAGFGRLVFFTPAQPPVVSLEPQTCVPNAFRLAGEGTLPTGMVVLEPSATWQGWFELRAEAL